MKTVKDLAKRLAQKEPYQDFKKPHPVRDRKQQIAILLANHKKRLKNIMTADDTSNSPYDSDDN